MKFHHVGIAVANIAKHAEQYEKALGIKLTSEITEDKIQKVRVAFARIGDDEVFVEFVEPVDESSPVAGILRRSGGGLYHVCYVVPDIDAAIERVRLSGGLIVSGPVPAAAFDGRRIAFVYTPDRSLVEFLEESHMPFEAAR